MWYKKGLKMNSGKIKLPPQQIVCEQFAFRKFWFSPSEKQILYVLFYFLFILEVCSFFGTCSTFKPWSIHSLTTLLGTPC